MSTNRRRLMRLIVGGAAAISFTAAPAAIFTIDAPAASAEPCYNGVMPWAPGLPSCSLPGPVGPRVRGAAPDATAIIACRNHPGCLSWYINGP